MKRFLSIMFLAVMCQGVSSQEEVAELGHIVKEIDRFRDKAVSMTMKFKIHDTVFEHISFYDRKNHDIEFDVSEKEVKRRLKDAMLNLHQGMDYTVVFTVKAVGPMGNVVADVIGFEPVLLLLLPEKR